MKRNEEMMGALNLRMEEALVAGFFDDGIAWPRTRSAFNVIGCCRCVRFLWTDMTPVVGDWTEIGGDL